MSTWNLLKNTHTHTHTHTYALYVIINIFYMYIISDWASLVVQSVKNLTAMQETWVQSLDPENPWRSKWQCTLVFLSGEFHGQRSLMGYSSWDRQELDMTEQKTHTQSLRFAYWKFLELCTTGQWTFIKTKLWFCNFIFYQNILLNLFGKIVD